MRLFSAMFNAQELQGYSDEEFDRLVWQAKFRRGDAIWVIPLGAGLLAAAVWVGVSVMLMMGMKSAGTTLVGIALGRWAAINVVVALTIAIAAGAFTRWRMIITSIKRIVNKAGCPFCEFSLVGLRVQHGWVQCPECGQRVYLFEHRMTPEDLVPEGQKYKPLEGAGPTGAYKPVPDRKRKPASRPGANVR